MGEFDLIKQYFIRNKRLDRTDVLLAIGDDCAVTQVPAHHRLAITTDTLVCDTHFLADICPADLAYKAIAVNLSDLAAMGATPRWVSLALTLPKCDHHWLSLFSQGLFQILDEYDVELIGGDTTKGHLSLTITAQGFIPQQQGLFRHQAKVNDLIYASGYLGDSAAGLDLLLNPKSSEFNSAQHYLLQRHLKPTPRVTLGKLLLDYSQCAIDISDGLLADLSHILSHSQCSAEIEVDKLPLSQAIQTEYSHSQAINFALTGGEDYELCFTIPENKQIDFENMLKVQQLNCYCIGKITSQSAENIRLLNQGKTIPLPKQIGFDHFR
ncbi:thiamine-phosphate kinase [Ursidibacter arcticus]|uniref:thiamine-phosphate kinase n=1 Tax=Ursidibacter arcticus TaxID=1524965 RepID=UPI0012F70974|nr:thiamine-phosphate kinase [Ursidibacter arcticus]KAE9531775.1 thiamine-phosphate kinase [Ursidibacter arcticus]